ncbi:MAG: hypothetical protein HYS04_22480 [Acidobacteria bacterium]|nr:hypothetical protein [Acidobacteriota bacterium]
MRRVSLCCIPLLLSAGSLLAQETAAPRLTREAIEQFLLNAKVVKTRGINIGVTGSIRATLSDGKLTHDAHVQNVDVRKPQFQTDRGTEMNFRDSWKFNIAAYRLDRLLGLDMIPPSVERRLPGLGLCAVTWWVDDVLMDEVTRHKKKIEPPDPEAWNRQMYLLRIFDQLIYNVDRNLQNVLVTKDWNVWMIDHTRAFRLYKSVKEAKNLVRCDRKLLDALRNLQIADVKRETGEYLTPPEVNGLMARRDQIVKFFEAECAKKGENAVLYEMVRKR